MPEELKINPDFVNLITFIRSDGFEQLEREPTSFHTAVIVGICRFVNLYEGDYGHDKLVRDLMGVDPKEFIKEAESDEELVGVNHYLNWLYKRYNSTVTGKMLPKKF